MANPLFSMLGNQMQSNNGMMGLIQQFMNFKKNFNGDPRQQIRQLVQQIEQM